MERILHSAHCGGWGWGDIGTDGTGHGGQRGLGQEVLKGWLGLRGGQDEPRACPRIKGVPVLGTCWEDGPSVSRSSEFPGGARILNFLYESSYI